MTAPLLGVDSVDIAALQKKTVICQHCGSINTFLESDGAGSQESIEVVCLCGWRTDLGILEKGEETTE